MSVLDQLDQKWNNIDNKQFMVTLDLSVVARSEEEAVAKVRAALNYIKLRRSALTEPLHNAVVDGNVFADVTDSLSVDEEPITVRNPDATTQALLSDDSITAL